MKKHLIYLAAAATVLAACSNETGINSEPSNATSATTAELQVVTGIGTRGAITGSQFSSTDDALGLYVVEMSSGTLSPSGTYNEKEYKNWKFTLTNPDIQTWTAESNIILAEGKDAYVYAYYPYSTPIEDATKIAVTIAANANSTNDYMYFTPTADGTDGKATITNPYVTLKMSHVLSAASLQAKRYYMGSGTEPATPTIIINSVKVVGVNPAGTFSIDGGKYAATESSTTVDTGFSGFSHSVTNTYSGTILPNLILIPPTTPTQMTVSVNLTGSTDSGKAFEIGGKSGDVEITLDLPSVEYAAGKNYLYSLIFKYNDDGVVSPEIDPNPGQTGHGSVDINTFETVTVNEDVYLSL